MNTDKQATPATNAAMRPSSLPHQTLEWLCELWRAQAKDCREMAERLGDGHNTHNELLRAAAQYEQSAGQVERCRARELDASQPAQAGEAVAYRYRYRDPISGNPIWRSEGEEWNAQRPYETQALYTRPQPAQGEHEQRSGEPAAWLNVIGELSYTKRNSDDEAVGARAASRIRCLELAFDAECADVDKIIAKIGVDRERARTDGGSLNLPRILNHLQETFDELVRMNNAAGAFSDKNFGLKKEVAELRTKLAIAAQQRQGGGA